jgi:small-conductance mechanosensitive channel
MIRSLLLALIAFVVLAPAAPAQPPAAAPVTPADAQRTLDILQDPKQRDQLIANLKAIAAAQPKPAGPQAALAPDSLGAQLLGRVTQWTGQVSVAAAETVTVAAELPGFGRRLIDAALDPVQRAAATDTAWRIAAALLAAIGAGLLARRALRRAAARLAALRGAPGPADAPPDTWELLRRLPNAAALLLLALVPTAAFAAVGDLVAGLVAGGNGLAAPIGVELVNAYAMFRIVMSVGAVMAAPEAPRRRLVPFGDAAAAAAVEWLGRIAGTAIFGSALAGIVTILGLPRDGHDAVLRLTLLVLAALAVILVWNCRHAAAGSRWVARPGAAWSVWIAETWPYFAVAAIVVVWLILTGGIDAGLDPLPVLIGTFAVLVAARIVAVLVLGLMQRAVRFAPERGGEDAEAAVRLAAYQRAGRRLVVAAIAVGTAIALLHVWGVDAAAWFAPNTFGRHLASALATIAVAVAAAIAVWEAATAVLDRHIAGLADADAARAARLRTLLPLLRTALLTTIVLIVALTGLSEIGVNIAPLLAGAGIVGIAVGFGSQTLVHDVITGMLVLLENAVQIGDTVTAAGLTGTVEELTVRTLRLRAGDGALHIVPFSAVGTITNTSRGFGNAAFSVSVRPDEDLERVGEALTGIGAELREDPAFAPLMLGNLQLWGIDGVSGKAITFAGQIQCTVAGRLPVQREFYRRVIERFRGLGIALAD